MKYLLLRKPKYSFGSAYEIEEFATAEELAAHIVLNGSKDAIVAQRIGLKLEVCAWQPSPVERDNF